MLNGLLLRRMRPRCGCGTASFSRGCGWRGSLRRSRITCSRRRARPGLRWTGPRQTAWPFAWGLTGPHPVPDATNERVKGYIDDIRDHPLPPVGEGSSTALVFLRSALRYVCLRPRSGAPADYSGRRSCCVVPFSCGASLRRFSSALQGLPPPVPALGSLLPLLLPPDSALRPLLPPVGEGTGMRARRANQTPKSEKA